MLECPPTCLAKTDPRADVTHSRSELRSIPLPVDPTWYDISDAAGTVGSAMARWRWTLHDLDDVAGGALVALEAITEVLADAGGVGNDLGSLGESVEGHIHELATEHGPKANMVDLLGYDDPLVIATEAVDRNLSLAGRAVCADLPPEQAPVHFGEHNLATLSRIGVSDGGVPKAEVESATVGELGLVGDGQRNRRHHGRPFQSVCLYSADLIAALSAEGHPIEPGSVGENLTLSAIDWSQIRPGMRLAISSPIDESDEGGSPVLLEITSWAQPCSNVKPSFSDGDNWRLDFDKSPGSARAYASVVLPGTISKGAEVDLLF